MLRLWCRNKSEHDKGANWQHQKIKLKFCHRLHSGNSLCLCFSPLTFPFPPVQELLGALLCSHLHMSTWGPHVLLWSGPSPRNKKDFPLPIWTLFDYCWQLLNSELSPLQKWDGQLSDINHQLLTWSQLSINF